MVITTPLLRHPLLVHSASAMFDPTFPQQSRKVDFSGRSQLEDKQTLLNRTRQERQQRQHLQNQNSAATRIQRWYRAHRQRQRTRPTLRARYDTEWQLYTRSLSTPAADGVGRQRALSSLVRLLWLFYDNGADGMRLVALVAAIVKSNNDHNVQSTHSYFHTATATITSVSFASTLPWSLQASNLCVLCISKLIHDVRAAVTASVTSSASAGVAVVDKRVYSLVLAALTLLLDQSKWNTKGAATTGAVPPLPSAAVQHQQLLLALSSLSSPFFPALHILLSRLSQCDTQRAHTPYVVALLSSVLKCCASTASTVGVYDSFTRRVVSNVLTIPIIASYVVSTDQLRALVTADGGRLLSLLVGVSLSLYTTSPAMLNSPSLALTTTQSTAIPASTMLLANLVTLVSLVAVSEHTVDTVSAYLQLLSPLIPTISARFLTPATADGGSKTVGASGRSSAVAASLRLPSHSIARFPPPEPTQFEHMQRDISKQFSPLFSSSFILSLVNRVFHSTSSDRAVTTLSSYSLTASPADVTEQLLTVFGSFLHSHPSYLPLVARLITLLVDRSPAMRPVLSSLTFTTPLLAMLWRQMEVTVGCKLTGHYRPSAATANSLRSAPHTSSLLSSLFTSHNSHSSTAAAALPADPVRAARQLWEEAILGSRSRSSDGHFAALFLLFSHCFLPLLFILEDDELVAQHQPFPSLATLQAYAQLMKQLLFRLVWDEDTERRRGGQYSDYMRVCRLILVELYQRDIRCRWMQAVEVKGSGGLVEVKDEEDEEKRVVKGGKAWLVDEDEGGKEFLTAWHYFLEHGDSIDLDHGTETDEKEEKHSTGSLHSRVVKLIRTLPFLVSFHDRAVLFRRMLAAHRAAQSTAFITELKVRRNNLIQDGLFAVSYQGKIRVKFVDESGEEEEGLDIGGSFKELLELLTREIFRLDYGLFVCTDQGTFYPNPRCSEVVESSGELLASVGRLLGKCISEQILLEVPLAVVVLEKLIGQGRVLGDLREMDKALYQSLMAVKRYEGAVEDLCLTFSVDEEWAGQSRTVELVEGGAQKPVTNTNRIAYLYAVADYHLNTKLRSVLSSFVGGLGEVVSLSSLRLFNLSEVRLLLSGSHQPLNVDDWQAHTRYDGCSDGDRHIRWFWSCVRAMTDKQQKQLLAFVTSVSRAPYLGFAALQPPFTMRLVGLGEGAESGVTGVLLGLFGKKSGSGALPSAATCFNLLKLPQYTSQGVMKEKLLMAIEAKGFHLV